MNNLSSQDAFFSFYLSFLSHNDKDVNKFNNFNCEKGKLTNHLSKIDYDGTNSLLTTKLIKNEYQEGIYQSQTPLQKTSNCSAEASPLSNALNLPETPINLYSNSDFGYNFNGCNNNLWMDNNPKNETKGKKLYSCNLEDCGKSYKSKENLTLHIKNKHLGEKPYQCRFCNSRFSHRNGNHKNYKTNFFRQNISRKENSY